MIQQQEMIHLQSYMVQLPSTIITVAQLRVSILMITQILTTSEDGIGRHVQTCTEMIMQTDGNDNESIFPPSESQYKDQVSYCKEAYGVEPRPNWITTEFGPM